MRNLVIVLMTFVPYVHAGLGYSVCLHPLSCFNMDVPFDDTPQAPDDINLKFHLYTRKNTHNADVLNYEDHISLTATNFDGTLPVKVLVHGYLASADNAWMKTMKDELLKKGNFNVLLTDWSQGAGLDYFQSAANVVSVADGLKKVLSSMNLTGVSWDDMHLIGHSLGAHICGVAGLLSDSKIGRISGLDPASVGFGDEHKQYTLDKKDAKFVDVIHTNMESFKLIDGYGTSSSSGHVDFYPDGGEHQNGCDWTLPGCSHQRSHDLYIESINSNCKFMAFPCGNYEDFLEGKCLTCGKQGCGILGYHSDQGTARGARFLDTQKTSPYCGYEYKVKITPHPSVMSTKGLLSISAKEGGPHTPLVSLTKSTTKLNQKSITRGALFDRNIDNATSIDIKFQKVGFFSSDTYRVSKIEITNAITGKTFTTCPGSHYVESGLLATFKIDNGHCRDFHFHSFIG